MLLFAAYISEFNSSSQNYFMLSPKSLILSASNLKSSDQAKSSDITLIGSRPATLVEHKISMNGKENQYFRGKNLYDYRKYKENPFAFLRKSVYTDKISMSGRYVGDVFPHVYQSTHLLITNIYCPWCK